MTLDRQILKELEHFVMDEPQSPYYYILWWNDRIRQWQLVADEDTLIV